MRRSETIRGALTGRPGNVDQENDDANTYVCSRNYCFFEFALLSLVLLLE